MIDLLDLTALSPPFEVEGASTPGPSGRRRWGMLPFPAATYQDDVLLYRVTPSTGSQGGSRRTFAAEPVESVASVQSRKVDRMDPGARLSSAVAFSVFTPVDLDAAPSDRIVWTDRTGVERTLTVKLPTEPKGIASPLWVTHCEGAPTRA